MSLILSSCTVQVVGALTSLMGQLVFSPGWDKGRFLQPPLVSLQG